MRLQIISFLVTALVAGCAGTPASRDFGSQHTHRFQQPPERAARCFASNAEEHSSALMSDVQVDRSGNAYVTVSVKNGVPYATADIRRSGQGSTGTIAIMVVSSSRYSDLLGTLTKGC